MINAIFASSPLHCPVRFVNLNGAVVNLTRAFVDLNGAVV
jgi:hypothetical protein